MSSRTSPVIEPYASLAFPTRPHFYGSFEGRVVDVSMAVYLQGRTIGNDELLEVGVRFELPISLANFLDWLLPDDRSVNSKGWCRRRRKRGRQ